MTDPQGPRQMSDDLGILRHPDAQRVGQRRHGE